VGKLIKRSASEKPVCDFATVLFIRGKAYLIAGTTAKKFTHSGIMKTGAFTKMAAISRGCAEQSDGFGIESGKI
jgi:hypothetical protein